LKQHFDYQIVLENGVGLWSTPYFLKNCRQVISTEFDRQWAGRYDTGHPRHTLMIPEYEGFRLPNAGVMWEHCNNAQQNTMIGWFSRFRTELAFLDLLFVDGCPCERVAALKALSGHPTAIVLHDFNFPYYPDLGWLDREYAWMDCRSIMPSTRLYLKRSGNFDMTAIARAVDEQAMKWMAEGR